MGSQFSKMKKQARLIESQIDQMRQEMKKQTYTGSSGNGLVEVVIDGERNILSISIKPDCVDPQDVEGLQDLLKAAFSQAHEKQSAGTTEMMPQMPF
jgi:nucleoid-associated protein EbfC